MPIDFPNSPVTNQTFSAGGKNWRYDGTAWILVGVTPVTRDIMSDSQNAAILVMEVSS